MIIWSPVFSYFLSVSVCMNPRANLCVPLVAFQKPWLFVVLETSLVIWKHFKTQTTVCILALIMLAEFPYYYYFWKLQRGLWNKVSFPVLSLNPPCFGCEKVQVQNVCVQLSTSRLWKNSLNGNNHKTGMRLFDWHCAHPIVSCTVNLRERNWSVQGSMWRGNISAQRREMDCISRQKKKQIWVKERVPLISTGCQALIAILVGKPFVI